ncbi:MAG: Hsp70 family protein [Pseudonocardiaceae bacterium]|jgi:YVTN family beta-propeller protein
MSYSLGVDVGATFVAAAVAEVTTVEMFILGDHAALVPAAVHLGDDGVVSTWDAATGHGKYSPARIGCGLMSRLGDPAPVLLGGAAYEVTDLVSVLLRDVVHKVTTTQGKPPEHVALTHPASWGPFRRALFEKAARQAGLIKPTMVTEPDAAAARYAGCRPWNDGETVAVYDLGGSTFNATVLRKHSGKIQILGKPERIEGLGGDDLDDAILTHVSRTAGGALTQLDKRRPESMVALAGLRQNCIRTKEALTTDAETTFPVSLPNSQRFDVHIARPDFEDLARGVIESTVRALSRALQSAQVQPADLSAVLLAGGSSSVPLVAEMVSAELGRPVIVDEHPQYIVALGAATLAARATQYDTSQHEGRHYRGRQNDSQPTYSTMAGSPTAPATVAGAVGRPGPQSFILAQRTNHMIPTQRSVDTAPTQTPLPEKTVAAARAALGHSAIGTDTGTAQAPAPVAMQPSTQSLAPVYFPAPDKPHDAPEEGGQSQLLALTDRVRQPRVLIGTGVAVAVALTGSILLSMFAGGNNIPVSAHSRLTAPLKPEPTAVASVEPEVAMPTVGATIRVGNSPSFVAVSPNSQYAYITNGNTQAITVVDTARNQVTATIPVATGPPQFLTFAPDGRTLYVTVSNDQGTIHAIDVLDTGSNTVIATIPQPGMPLRVAVAPDGKRLFVANHELPFVSVIDTATNTVIGQVHVAPNPHWVTFSPDGSRAYTANHESNLISVIDTATLDVLATIPVGKSPHSIAVNPRLPLVANVNFDAHSVSEIDTTTNEIVATIPVGENPQDVAWAPDGRFAYVVNDGSNTASVIDTTTNQVTETIPTGAGPTSIAVRPDGRLAYISNLNSGTVTVLKLTH